MATHVEVEFTVVDEAAYALTDGGLFFEFLDEKDERIAEGVAAGNGVFPVEGAAGNEKKFLQKDTFAAMDELPTKITIQGFNIWEKNRYEAHAFELK